MNNERNRQDDLVLFYVAVVSRYINSPDFYLGIFRKVK